MYVLPTIYLTEWRILVLSVFIGYIFYYLAAVVKCPILAVRRGPFLCYLRRHVPIIGTCFWPTWWCIEGRAQTLLARIIRTRLVPKVKYRREILSLKDGGQVALDWLEPRVFFPKSPIVVILPGVLGDSQAEYVKLLALTASSIRVQAVVFNYRGLAGVALKTPRLYSAASDADLAEVLNHVRRMKPNAKVAAAGISMGSLILGNYLVRNAEKSKLILTAAFMISVPWNMYKGLESIERPVLNMMLNRHLTADLCRLISKHAVLNNDKFDWNMKLVEHSSSIREFDTRFTAKNTGFNDFNSYYAHATLHDKLHRIQIPTLCLNAADDPFQPVDAIPLDEAMTSTHVAIVLTARGGHIGFLEGFWPFRKDHFMCRLFRQYIRSVLFDADLEFEFISQYIDCY